MRLIEQLWGAEALDRSVDVLKFLGFIGLYNFLRMGDLVRHQKETPQANGK
jgi:hypothetical protein